MLLSCLYIDYLYSLAISGRIVFLKGGRSGDLGKPKGNVLINPQGGPGALEVRLGLG